MSWEEVKRENYGKDYWVSCGRGTVDFSLQGMEQIDTRGISMSYDEYLDIQWQSIGETRIYFELCFFNCCSGAEFTGQIDRFKSSKGKVLFKRIKVLGMYADGNGFYGKEDHVWMDSKGFEKYSAGDCLRFSAEVYRYLKIGNGKKIDYGLQNPVNINKVEFYTLPTDDALIDQLICETCRYEEQCFMGMCLMNEKERKERFELLKNFQPGKFTNMTVLLAYELEYRMFYQIEGYDEDRDDPVSQKLLSICRAQPIYYTGIIQEAFFRMAYPEKTRLYINDDDYDEDRNE